MLKFKNTIRALLIAILLFAAIIANTTNAHYYFQSFDKELQSSALDIVYKYDRDNEDYGRQVFITDGVLLNRLWGEINKSKPRRTDDREYSHSGYRFYASYVEEEKGMSIYRQVSVYITVDGDVYLRDEFKTYRTMVSPELVQQFIEGLQPRL